jgi:butyryl-CoA dehydrogenase
MSSAVSTGDGLADAQAFAESVAGMVRRAGPGDGSAGWAPGAVAQADARALTAALDELGWPSVAADPDLIACAGLGGVELGRALAPLALVDGLLGASPLSGELIRCGVDGGRAIGSGLILRAIGTAKPVPSADGIDVHRVTGLGDPLPLDPDAWRIAFAAWLAASVGYLAGVGEGALDLTVTYVRQRRAFDTTLAALAPVQQLLARAATEIRGVRLLAATAPGADALAHAGPAVADACAACQQVTGAIGFTLEYPLQRYTQRARALATWNDALLDALTPD